VGSSTTYYGENISCECSQGGVSLSLSTTANFAQTTGSSGSASVLVITASEVNRTTDSFTLTRGPAVWNTTPLTLGPSGQFSVLITVSATQVNQGDAAGAIDALQITPIDLPFYTESGSTLDPPGSTGTTLRGTTSLPPPDEFDAQLLVGWYTDSSGATAGFQVSADGTIQAPIVAPGDTLHFTEAMGINNAGTIVGTYENMTAIGIPGNVATFHAFSRTPDGTFTTYDFGAGVSTGFQAINNNGDIVGDFGTSAQVSQGFLLPKAGSPITFGVPGLNTYPQAVNDSDTVVGVYVDGSGNYHGFQWSNTGLLTTFDFPGAVSTHAEGINNGGTISGYFIDPSGKTHGFFGPLGLFKEYHLAGNPTTLPRGINDFGTVTGSYADSKGVLHGFVAQLCAADVSSDIHVAQGALTLDSKTGEYHETVTLKNKGHTAIAGPLRLLFDNLPSGVFPVNGRNFSRCTEALTPFITLRPTGGTLQPGSSISAKVKFVNSLGGTITYTPRVLAGKRP